jgi:hypothetical protein
MKGRTARAAVATLAGLGLAGLTGCVAPASSTSDYLGKAGHTAADALSQLETARLAVETADRGNMLHTTLKVVLSQAEDSFSSIQATFDSIQPPDSADADKARSRLDQILSTGADGMAQMRIAARRSDTVQLDATATDLATVSTRLQEFSDKPSA